MTGFATSVFVFTIIIFYSSMQLMRLHQAGETLVTLSMRDSNFNDTYIVSSEEHGLKFAFALTAYDTNYDYVDESDYGSVSAKYAQWGIEGHSYTEQ